MPKIKCKKLYRNKEWLYNKYIEEELSTTQISKFCNSGNTVIWNWLYRLNIPMRFIGEAIHLRKTNHCNLSSKAME